MDESKIEEKTIDDMLIAGIRYQGSYAKCGFYFKKLGWSFGRSICGKPFNLYYDEAFMETDADIESCFPIKQRCLPGNASIRVLAGGRCASSIHHGPYEDLRVSYNKLKNYLIEKGYQTKIPSREIYIKGPGIFLKGNPDKYMTEIQIMIEDEGH